MSLLTEANLVLIKELATMLAKIAKLESKLVTMCGSGANWPSIMSSTRKTRAYHNGKYCWTHDFHVADSHTSQSCKTANTNHKQEATHTTIMGGSTANKQLVDLN